MNREIHQQQRTSFSNRAATALILASCFLPIRCSVKQKPIPGIAIPTASRKKEVVQKSIPVQLRPLRTYKRVSGQSLKELAQSFASGAHKNGEYDRTDLFLRIQQEFKDNFSWNPPEELEKKKQQIWEGARRVYNTITKDRKLLQQDSNIIQKAIVQFASEELRAFETSHEHSCEKVCTLMGMLDFIDYPPLREISPAALPNLRVVLQFPDGTFFDPDLPPEEAFTDRKKLHRDYTVTPENDSSLIHPGEYEDLVASLVFLSCQKLDLSGKYTNQARQLAPDSVTAFEGAALQIILRRKIGERIRNTPEKNLREKEKQDRQDARKLSELATKIEKLDPCSRYPNSLRCSAYLILIEIKSLSKKQLPFLLKQIVKEIELALSREQRTPSRGSLFFGFPSATNPLIRFRSTILLRIYGITGENRDYQAVNKSFDAMKVLPSWELEYTKTLLAFCQYKNTGKRSDLKNFMNASTNMLNMKDINQELRAFLYAFRGRALMIGGREKEAIQNFRKSSPDILTERERQILKKASEQKD